MAGDEEAVAKRQSWGRIEAEALKNFETALWDQQKALVAMVVVIGEGGNLGISFGSQMDDEDRKGILEDLAASIHDLQKQLGFV